MVLIDFRAITEGPPGSVGAVLGLLAQQNPQQHPLDLMAVPPYQSIVRVQPPPFRHVAPYNGLLLPHAAPNAPPAPPNQWTIALLHDQQNSYYVNQNTYFNNGTNDGSGLVFPDPMSALLACTTLNLELQAWVRAVVPGHALWVFPYTGEGWSIEALCHGVVIPRYTNGLWENSFEEIVGKAIHACMAANMVEMTLGPAEQLNGVQREHFLVIRIAIQQVRREYERRSVLYDPGD